MCNSTQSAKVARMIDAMEAWETQVKAAVREAVRDLDETHGLSTD